MNTNKFQVGGQLLQQPKQPLSMDMLRAKLLARTHGKESFFHKGIQYSSQNPNETDSAFIKYLNSNTPEQFKKDPVINYPDYSNEPLDTIPLNQVNQYQKPVNKVKLSKPKFQQGGLVNQQQQMVEQIAQMIQQAGPEQTVQALVQSGVPQEQATQMVQQVMLMIQGQAQSARKGAKLNYLKRLNNQCPEGTELKFYKKGGVVCPVCEKTAKACKGKKLQKGGNVIEEYKKGRKC